MDQPPLVNLANLLATLSPSDVIEGDLESAIEGLLNACWSSLKGSSDQSTEPYKLIGRVENLTWSPPNLYFDHERHGSLKQGSGRAELYHWEVNVSSGVANIMGESYRQLVPMDKRMDTLAKAEETAKLILSKEEHSSIKWIEPGIYAVVNIGAVIPATNKDTTASRRKRYRGQLEKIMLNHGWLRENRGNKIGFRFPAG